MFAPASPTGLLGREGAAQRKARSAKLRRKIKLSQKTKLSRARDASAFLSKNSEQHGSSTRRGDEGVILGE
jgi:hypothetical protein